MSIADWIQISISSFTLFAVIVAIFGEKIRFWFYGPKIIVEFDRQNERCLRWALVQRDIIQDQQEVFENVKRYYFRLRVANQGSILARQLRAKIELYFSDETLADRFEPSSLRWVSGSEIVDLAPREDEYLNLISQVMEPEIKGYKLRIELMDMTLRGIAWDRSLDSWILKVSIHGENIYTPVVKFFRFDPSQEKDQPGDLKEIRTAYHEKNKIMVDKIRDNSETIKEIQDRFRFILLVAIFFYTVMSKLSDIYSNDKSGEFTVSYAGLVAFYFIVYFLFEIFKKEIGSFWLKTINILTLVGIGIFILPIILISLADKIPANLLLVVFKLPFGGILIMPVVLTAIISWASSFKKK